MIAAPAPSIARNFPKLDFVTAVPLPLSFAATDGPSKPRRLPGVFPHPVIGNKCDMSASLRTLRDRSADSRIPALFCLSRKPDGQKSHADMG
jgi:hypothetical protein